MSEPVKHGGRPKAGPWWLFATFDPEWRVVSVDLELSRGVELVDERALKKLRLVDEPIRDKRRGLVLAKRLKLAYEGQGETAGKGGRQVKAIHVDRNPPNFANRELNVKQRNA